eukprot:gene7518-biopygen7841
MQMGSCHWKGLGEFVVAVDNRAMDVDSQHVDKRVDAYVAAGVACHHHVAGAEGTLSAAVVSTYNGAAVSETGVLDQDLQPISLLVQVYTASLDKRTVQLVGRYKLQARLARLVLFAEVIMELVTILFVVDGIEKGWKAPDLVFLAVDFAAISVELSNAVGQSTDATAVGIDGIACAAAVGTRTAAAAVGVGVGAGVAD